ncbi:MAG: hypothetical protein NTZ83_01200 [Candidatus Pacearchaeota archaeon]|nr:hypothetical protein [Candidatus Pacearchaeota archaeon]
MSEIEDILEKATIKFPKSISFDNAEKLLLSISEGIQGEVHYSLDWPKSFVYNEEEKRSKNGDPRGRTLGSITIKDNKTHASEIAKVIPYDGESSQFSSMVFNIDSRLNLSEYRKETIQLWDDVRGIVERYFSEH